MFALVVALSATVGWMGYQRYSAWHAGVPVDSVGITKANGAFTFSAPLSDTSAVAGLQFYDGAGKVFGFEEFSGKAVLLNLWATWCAPCLEEMPALDRLQAALGGDTFQVVALSVDRLGHQSVLDFYEQLGITQLGVYLDPAGKSLNNLRVMGLPTSLLLDAQGRELGRYLGSAAWDSEPVLAAIRELAQLQQGSTGPG